MSEARLPKDGSNDAESVDSSIQRRWDRFALSDPSVDAVVQRSALSVNSPRSNNVTIATRDLGSLLALDVTSSPSDVVARPVTIDFADDDRVASHRSRDFR